MTALPAPASVRLAARMMMRYPLYWGKWTLLVIAAIYTTIGFVVTNLGTPGEVSSPWASSIWVLQWVAFPGGIAIGWCVPILIAHGITRRAASAGGAVAVLGLALVAAGMVQIGMAVEWLAFRAAGIPYRVGGGHLFDAAGQVHLVLADYGLNLASFLVSGLLVFLMYYRYRWRGTLLVPLALVPPSGVVLALSAGWPGPPGPEEAGWSATLGTGPAVVLAAAAVAAGLVGVYGLARAMPVRSRAV